MNLQDTVKINKQIIALILSKSESEDASSLPLLERNYIDHLKMDIEKAERWIRKPVRL